MIVHHPCFDDLITVSPKHIEFFQSPAPERAMLLTLRDNMNGICEHRATSDGPRGTHTTARTTFFMWYWEKTAHTRKVLQLRRKRTLPRFCFGTSRHLTEAIAMRSNYWQLADESHASSADDRNRGYE